MDGLLDGTLHGESLDARCAQEAVHVDAVEYRLHVLRDDEGATVDDDPDIRVRFPGGGRHGGHPLARLVQRCRLLGPDEAAHRQPDMGTNDVSTDGRHRGSLLRGEGVGHGEDLPPTALSDQLDLTSVAQVGRVDVLAELAVVQPGRRDVRDPRVPEADELVDQRAERPVGVGRPDAGNDRRARGDGQDLASQLDRHGVRVPISQVPRQRSVAVHAEGASVVGHQGIDAGSVRGLGDQPDSGPTEHERLGRVHSRLEAAADPTACHSWHVCLSLGTGLAERAQKVVDGTVRAARPLHAGHDASSADIEDIQALR